MRSVPNGVLDTVVGGLGDAGFGLSGFGGSSFSSGIQDVLGSFRANAPSSDYLGAIGQHASSKLTADMANGISPLSGKGW